MINSPDNGERERDLLRGREVLVRPSDMTDKGGSNVRMVQRTDLT